MTFPVLPSLIMVDYSSHPRRLPRVIKSNTLRFSFINFTTNVAQLCSYAFDYKIYLIGRLEHVRQLSDALDQRQEFSL